MKKKLLILIQLMLLTVLYSSMPEAHDWHRHGHHGGGHHGHHGWGHPGRGWHERDSGYYSQPQYNNYYAEPEPRYYGPQPRYYDNDRRSHQGLAGGVIGSIFGYQIGSGDPIAAGLGAAAGSFLGNGFGARY